ncbi:MAG: N-acetyltransferase [Lachnospiraceae bacterium]
MEFVFKKNQIALYDSQELVIAEVTFPDLDADTVEIDHTFVDDSLRGQGVAGQLMTAAAKELRRQKKKAVLTCSYAVNWFGKHPEYADIVKK